MMPGVAGAGCSGGQAARCSPVTSEEGGDPRGEVLGHGDQAEVTVVVHVERGVGKQPRHDPGVDEGDGVVVAGQDQHRLPDEGQGRQAGPARAGEQLEHVAALRSHPRVLVPQALGQVGLVEHLPPCSTAAMCRA